MKKYNLIAVFNKTADQWLMCKRKKPPYKGLANLVGGKVELGESGIDAAYIGRRNSNYQRRYQSFAFDGFYILHRRLLY